MIITTCIASFLSTLSLRRATVVGVAQGADIGFLSTLSLRRATCCFVILLAVPSFLSTLSLRRATGIIDIINDVINDFYPRSPCGERHFSGTAWVQEFPISIHALLAESDKFALLLLIYHLISIHALLAESDASWFAWLASHVNFYPRSPCGERRHH